MGEATSICMGAGLSDIIVCRSPWASKVENYDKVSLMRRVSTIQSVNFNVNSFSNGELPTDVCFKSREIGKITDGIGWFSVTSRNRYVCDPVIATCILLHRLKTLNHLCNMETKFCKVYSKSQWTVLWFTWRYDGKYGNKLKLDGELLRSRAHFYLTAKKNAGAPVENWVAFSDCTRIKIQRHGGTNPNQISF